MTKLQFNTISALLKECRILNIEVYSYKLNSYHAQIEISYKDMDMGAATIQSEEQAKDTIDYLRKQINNHKHKSK